MSKIAFITSTGSYQADRIFVGAFGTVCDQGNFEIADELKGIHLFNLLTPASLKAQGIDLSSNLHVVDIEEPAGAGLRATVLSALRNRWLSIYDQQSLPPGLAKAALESERTMVDQAITKAIEKTGLQFFPIQIERAFEDVHVQRRYADDEDESSGADDFYINPRAIALNTASNAPTWLIAPTSVATDAMHKEARRDASFNYASGELVSEISIALPSWAQLPEIFRAIRQMPGSLLEEMGVVENAKFSTVEWHDSPRQVAGEAAAPNAISDEPGAENPAPSA